MKAFVMLAALSVSLASNVQEPPDPKSLYEAGQYKQAINAVASQGDQPSREATYLAGQSHLRLNQPDGARAQFARLSTGVSAEKPTAWSLVGQSATAVDRRQHPTRHRERQAGRPDGARAAPSELPARPGIQRGRTMGTCGGGLREVHDDRSGVRLRPLLRRTRVLENQASQPDGDTPRVLLEARARCPGAVSGGDAHETGPLNLATAVPPTAQKVCPIPKYQRPNGSRSRRVNGMP